MPSFRVRMCFLGLAFLASCGPSLLQAPVADLGVRQLGKACTKGRAEACVELGARGNAGAPDVDPGAGADALKRGCELGVADGCSLYGERLFYGKGVAADVAGAIAWFRRGCEGGDGGGCLKAGQILAGDFGVPADPDGAARLFDSGRKAYGAACDEGSGASCHWLGWMVERAMGGAYDTDVAVGAFRRGCDAGHGPACAALGRASERGEGGLRDFVAAARLYEKACGLGDPDGCALGARLRGEGLAGAEAPDAVIEQARRGCSGRSGAWCWVLGTLLERFGPATAVSMREASNSWAMACNLGFPAGCVATAEWIQRSAPGRKQVAIDNARRACDAGEAAGCRIVADLQESVLPAFERDALLERACTGGDGMACMRSIWRVVRSDAQRGGVLFARTNAWFAAGCDVGIAFDCGMQGHLYGGGEGRKQDFAVYTRLLGRACQLGNADACMSAAFSLQRFVAEGERDHDKAAEYEARAVTLNIDSCSRGILFACFHAARSHAYGQGVPKDIERARELFGRACSGGLENACREAGMVR